MFESHSHSLWAITCYFNPVGYRRRLSNYRFFRQCLKIPLVTVELSLEDDFELSFGDADILLQLRGNDIMWQKERLLNVALKSVPENCRKIAWLDCDVIFADENWTERASQALDQHVLVHLFQERCNLPRDVMPDQLIDGNESPMADSVMFRTVMGKSIPEDFCLADAPLKRRSTAGLAWASQREPLMEHGLYDACILGGADRAILCAALGKPDYGAQALAMSKRRAAHYYSWARAYAKAVDGRVGHIGGRLYHLWHGDLENRQYSARQKILERFDFDPYSDIALDVEGCWRWDSDKAKLHQVVREYFGSRKEDGEDPARTREERFLCHATSET
jgi:hypothetical protein